MSILIPKKWIKLNSAIDRRQPGSRTEYTTINTAGGDALPAQSGHSGEYLTTDGSSLSWAAIAGGGGNGIYGGDGDVPSNTSASILFDSGVWGDYVGALRLDDISYYQSLNNNHKAFGLEVWDSNTSHSAWIGFDSEDEKVVKLFSTDNSSIARVQIEPSVITLTSGSSLTWSSGLLDFTGTQNINAVANTASLTIGGYSLTAANAQPLLDLSGVWNTSGNPTAIKLNITNTASGGNAALIDLQVAGDSKFIVYKNGAGIFEGGLEMGVGNVFRFGSQSAIGNSSDGVIALYNNATTAFNRLQFGGTTSSFPSIKRSSTILQARFADDSAYTDFEVADEAYGSGWNGSVEVPTKNAVYDKIQALSALSLTVATQSLPYTALATDCVIIINDGSPDTLTLPTAVGISGKVYTIKNNDLGLFTVDAAGTETIDGSATLTVHVGESYTIVSDGANWFII